MAELIFLDDYLTPLNAISANSIISPSATTHRRDTVNVACGTCRKRKSKVRIIFQRLPFSRGKRSANANSSVQESVQDVLVAVSMEKNAITQLEQELNPAQRPFNVNKPR